MELTYEYVNQYLYIIRCASRFIIYIFNTNSLHLHNKINNINNKRSDMQYRASNFVVLVDHITITLFLSVRVINNQSYKHLVQQNICVIKYTINLE
jgi:hypothetical protein